MSIDDLLKGLFILLSPGFDPEEPAVVVVAADAVASPPLDRLWSFKCENGRLKSLALVRAAAAKAADEAAVGMAVASYSALYSVSRRKTAGTKRLLRVLK